MADVFAAVVRRVGGDDEDVGDRENGDVIGVDDHDENDNDDVVRLLFSSLDDLPVAGALVVPVVFGPFAVADPVAVAVALPLVPVPFVATVAAGLVVAMVLE